MNLLKICSLPLLLPLLSPAAQAWQLEIDNQWQSNVNNAANDSNALSDGYSRVNIGDQLDYSINAKHLLQWQYSADYQQHWQFDPLSRLGVATKVRYAWQPKFGFSQPWYDFTLGSQYDWFADDHRRQVAFSLTSQISQRITDRILANSGVQYQFGFAGHDVFADNQGNWFINLDYALTPSSAIYSSYYLVYGHIVSSALLSEKQPIPLANKSQVRSHHLVNESSNDYSVWVHEDAYGDEENAMWYSYRYNALSQLVNLGLNQQISPTLSADLLYQYAYSVSDEVNYHNHRLYLSLFAKF